MALSSYSGMRCSISRLGGSRLGSPIWSSAKSASRASFSSGISATVYRPPDAGGRLGCRYRGSSHSIGLFCDREGWACCCPENCEWSGSIVMCRWLGSGGSVGLGGRSERFDLVGGFCRAPMPYCSFELRALVLTADRLLVVPFRLLRIRSCLPLVSGAG